ncbi:MAG: TetR family transcriptional regulator C-terminal domain-containing protein [Lachnospiraceae bacterium]|nr:TetR family transcriptional regulator C-terminal domain-containing protein [Lachnospiraceae bacterium]
MPNDNQRIKLTKRLLREGLLHLLEGKSIDKITVKELCVESGINRATFYRHYDIPRDILTEIEHELNHSIRSLYTKPNNMQEFQQYIEKVFIHIYHNADLIRVLIRNKTSEGLTHTFNEMYQMFLDLKKDLRGVQKLDDESYKLLSSYCIGGIFFLMSEWLNEGMKKTPKEVAELLLQQFDKDFIF